MSGKKSNAREADEQTMLVLRRLQSTTTMLMDDFQSTQELGFDYNNTAGKGAASVKRDDEKWEKR